MRTDLRSLEVLLAVAEQGSIGGAAKALELRQPSVTDRLRRLERHLRLELVHRSPRGTTLTPEGAAVADWAREVLAASDRLEAGTAALRREHDSELQIAASMTIAEYLLPRWLAQLHDLCPDANVSLRMGNSSRVAADVVHDEVDLGFIEGLHTPPGLHTKVFATDELVVIAEPRHRWTRRTQPVSVDELAGAELIMRELGSGTREAFDAALNRAGHPRVHPHLELASTEAIKSAVLLGHGVGVLSELATTEDVSTGRLAIVPIDGMNLHRDLRMAWRSGTQLTGPAAELASCAVRETARRRT